jgi:hypothetical protein
MNKTDNVIANEQKLLSENIKKTVWKYGIPCAMITIIIRSECRKLDDLISKKEARQ